LKRVNNQLKNIFLKKMSHWLGEKIHLKKKTGSQPSFARSPGSWVNPAGQPGFCLSRSFALSRGHVCFCVLKALLKKINFFIFFFALN